MKTERTDTRPHGRKGPHGKKTLDRAPEYLDPALVLPGVGHRSFGESLSEIGGKESSIG